MYFNSLVFNFLGLCLEAFFYGIYSAIFVMYLRCHAQRSERGKQSVLFAAICVLYVLSLAIIILDITSVGVYLTQTSLTMVKTTYYAEIIGFIMFGCCDFIAQSILIYRCWIVWGNNIRVVIVPITLVFAFLATWIASIAPRTIVQLQISTQPHISHTLLLFSLVSSMAVNTMVTGMIVFKIFKVFRQAKSRISGPSLGATDGSRLRSIIFILIESGMALFCIQVARMTVTIYTDVEVYDLVVGIHQMLNGLTPTIILVRVSMGLSFHDEKTMADVTSIHWQNHPSSEADTEITSITLSHRELREI